MKTRTLTLLTTAVMVVCFALAPLAGMAQNSNSSTTSEMKTSGSEARKAASGSGHYMKHGRIVRGGKHFGRHIGKSGKHFGKGTKKATKKAIKHVIS